MRSRRGQGEQWWWPPRLAPVSHVSLQRGQHLPPRHLRPSLEYKSQTSPDNHIACYLSPSSPRPTGRTQSMLQAHFLNKPPFKGFGWTSPSPSLHLDPGRSCLRHLPRPLLTCPLYLAPQTWLEPCLHLPWGGDHPFPRYPVPSAGRGRGPAGNATFHSTQPSAVCCAVTIKTSAEDKFSSHFNRHLCGIVHGPAVRGAAEDAHRARPWESPPRPGLHFGLSAMPAPLLCIVQATHTPGLLPRDAHVPRAVLAGCSPWRCPTSCLLSTPEQGVRSSTPSWTPLSVPPTGRHR